MTEKINKEEMKAQAAQAISAINSTGLLPAGASLVLTRMANETIEIAADLEEKGGFKKLGAQGVTGEKVLDGPMVAKLTNNGPASIQKTNTKKQSQSDITGKSAGDGELTIAISQASPKAQKKLLTDVVGATKEQIEEVNKATSTAPDVVNKEIDKDPVAEMTKAIKSAKKAENVALDNPFGSLNDDLGSIGAKFGNLMGSLASLTQGTGSFKDLGTSIQDATSEATDPISGEKFFSRNVVEENGETNLSRSVSKGATIGDAVSSFQSLELKLLAKGFAGRHTNTRAYKFEPVTTQEEFELEIVNSPRELQNMVIGWLGNAKDVSFTVKELHLKLANSIPTEVEAIQSGIQHHYIIYPDGQVIRGRPIDFEMGDFNDEALRVGACNIQIMAGSTESKSNPKWKNYYSANAITPDQWKSLDILIESWFRVKPGGEVLSVQDIQSGKLEPGFSGVEYVKKFNKESIYQNKVGYSNLPQKRHDGTTLEVKTTTAEVAEEPAPVNVQGVPDPNIPRSLDDLKKVVIPEKVDVAEDKKKLDQAVNDIKTGKVDLDSKIKEASKIGTGLFGDFADNIKSSNNIFEAAQKTASSTRQKLIDNGYNYDTKTKSWNK